MPDIALALGGGGMKGIAHVGVIRRLRQEGFTIKAVTGTSAGSIFGAAVAAGYSSDDLVDLVKDAKPYELFRRGKKDGPALLGLAGLSERLGAALGDRTFADLAIPFACVAVDIDLGKEIILNKGRVIDAVLASCALPGLFPTQRIGKLNLVDGGVLDPVPVAVARYIAPALPIVAVTLSPVPEEWAEMPTPKIQGPNPLTSTLIEQVSRTRYGQALEIFFRAMDISNCMLAEFRLQSEHPDVIIRPDLQNFDMLDAVNSEEMISLGEKAAEAAIPAIREALSIRNSLGRLFRKAAPPGILITEEGF